MLQTFEFETLRSKGIKSPLASYCAKLNVEVNGVVLKSHARIDRGGAIGVGNFLLFRTTEIRTLMTDAARDPSLAPISSVESRTSGSQADLISAK